MNAIDRFRDFGVDDDAELTEAYENMIDEISGPVKIGSLEYTASHVLREIDPTAFRCGYNDWTDGLENDDFGGRYECKECGDRFNDETEADECCTDKG